MMTINEAITHCREKACGGGKCAEEHAQLAKWLERLQAYEVVIAEFNEMCSDADNGDLCEFEFAAIVAMKAFREAGWEG